MSRSKIRRPSKIISGGQTGVDRAALDAAMKLSIPHGGWCPRGRLAEDGRIAERYALDETSSPDYAGRTERNVLDSDGTLILHRGPLRGGTRFTRQLATRHQKPCLVVDLDDPLPVAVVRRWVVSEKIEVLNVAGPRESQSPEIGRRAERYLMKLFAKDRPS